MVGRGSSISYVGRESDDGDGDRGWDKMGVGRYQGIEDM